MKKHLDSSRGVPKEEGAHMDVIALRLREQYLIAAESAYYLGDNIAAASYIDDLIVRARKVPNAIPVVAGDMDIDFILDERARELGGEFLGWFDLKRTHKLEARLKAHNPDAGNIQDFQKLRPIPQSELDKIFNRDMSKQNTGYN